MTLLSNKIKLERLYHEYLTATIDIKNYLEAYIKRHGKPKKITCATYASLYDNYYRLQEEIKTLEKIIQMEVQQ